MALYPSDDLALDVSSDRMTFAVLAGGDRLLHELPDVAMALLLPQNGECVESCSKHASRIHTQRPHALSMAGVGKFLHMRSSLPRAGIPAPALHVSTDLGAVSVAKIFSPVGVESSAMRPATQRAQRIPERRLYLQQKN